MCIRDRFNDVQRARADQDRARNQGEAYANDVIPRAQGQAVRLLQEAEGYAEQVVNKARGDAERFRQVFASYRKSKDVTAKRLYLETMEEIFGKTQKVIIDNDSSNSGVLPFLPLNELRGKPATPR
jgi:membrane protease subunit HflK